jgi:hypothetical protein
MFSPGRDFLAVVFAMCAFVVLEVVVSKPLRNLTIGKNDFIATQQTLARGCQ